MYSLYNIGYILFAKVLITWLIERGIAPWIFWFFLDNLSNDVLYAYYYSRLLLLTRAAGCAHKCANDSSARFSFNCSQLRWILPAASGLILFKVTSVSISKLSFSKNVCKKFLNKGNV